MTEDIIALIMSIVAFGGFFFARWNATPTSMNVLRRLARVFDVSQIVDSTRDLSDTDPD